MRFVVIALQKAEISLAAAMSLLMSLHWLIILALLLSVLPATFVRTRYSRVLYEWSRRHTPNERKVSYLTYLMTNRSPAKEVRLDGLSGFLIDQWSALRGDLRRERRTIFTRSTAADLATGTFTSLVTYGAYAYAAFRTMRHEISIGSLTMYFGAFQRGQSILQQLLGGITGLYDNSLFLQDLESFLRLPPLIPIPSPPEALPAVLIEGIRIEEVSFSYLFAKTPALSAVSLTIGPGETVAIVGVNGSGKTTLVKLLCRLYDPTEGRITFDGVDLRNCSANDVQRRVSVAFSDYERFQFSARENIWLGDIARDKEDEGIVASAKAAGADQVIEGLENKYETLLGRMFEGGTDLSAGQWQKIAVARALLRDADLVILDEPTSAMDAASEQSFFEAFHARRKGKATLLITHRLSNVRYADRIYVLNRGCIVEQGKHEDLMAQGGEYARLFQLQAEPYQN